MVKSDFDRVEKAVAEVEQSTSAECVVSIQRSSAEYGWSHWICGSLASLLASMVLLVATRDSGWSTRISDLIQWQCLGFFVGSVLPYFPAVKHWIIPGAFQAQAVQRSAMVEFFKQGLTNTQGRSGLLIYVSLLERRVEIFADRGIGELFSDPEACNLFFKKFSDAIASGFQTSDPTTALCEQVGLIGQFLSEKLPPGAGRNDNELPNVRT